MIKAKKIQGLAIEALERDPQRRSVIHACPAAGMSGVNLFWLLKLTNESTQRLKTRATRRQS